MVFFCLQGMSQKPVCTMSNYFINSKPVVKDRPKTHLSPLAQEILVRLTDGQTTKTIASELGVTRDIVDGRVRRIYRRFGVKGVARLVHVVIREGWIAHPAV